MSLHGRLREVLLGDATIAGMVTARVYPLRIPQGATLPAIVYQRISSRAMGAHDGPGEQTRVRMQVTAIAADYNACRALALAIRHRLEGYREAGTNERIKAVLPSDIDTDMFDEDLNHFRAPADYFIWATDPVPA